MEARTQSTQPSQSELVNDPSVTDVRVSTDEESHTDTRILGDTVTFDESDSDRTNVHGTWPAEADEHVRELIDDAVRRREARENVRANHRNLNRMLTLFGALIIGLIVTFMLENKGIPGLVKLPPWSFKLAPYSFVITILMDSGLALYGFIRHY